MSDYNIEPPFTPNQFATALEYWKEAEKFQRKRAEAAIARIEASQEQEPVYQKWMDSDHGGWIGCTKDAYSATREGNRQVLYAAPVTLLDIADLQRITSATEDLAESLRHENAELTRKLAEQQVVIRKQIEAVDRIAPNLAHTMSVLAEQCGFEELTKLLAEAEQRGYEECVKKWLSDKPISDKTEASAAPQPRRFK